MKITTKLAPAYLAQRSQSMTLQLALLRPDGKNYERITPLVLCRDFLCDVFTFSKAKQDFGIYGMSFKGKTDAPYYKNVLLQAQFPNEQAEKSFREHLPLLHALEKHNNHELTEVFKTDAGETVVMGSPFWLENCLKFSLYTFLLRVMCYDFSPKDTNWIAEFGKASNTSDGRYAKSVATDSWEKILKDLHSLDTDEFCGFEVDPKNISTIHHNSGFISVFGSHTEINTASVKKNKHWALMKERGFTLSTK